MNPVMHQVLETVVAGWQTADALPKTRDSVANCFALSLFALLDEYMAHDSVLVREIDALVESLYNREDPLVKALGPTEVMTLHSVLNLLRQRKKHAQGKAEESTLHRPDSG
jgi:hypothetical protein